METSKENKFVKFLIKRKTLIIIFLFLIWMLFFDRNNFRLQYKYISKVKNLEKQIEYYDKKYKEDSLKLKMLKNDKKLFEKFAREEYYMHKPNEDVYIIKYQDNEK